VTHSLTANIGQFVSIVTALFVSFVEGRIFSRWIVTNINSARGTLYYRETRIPCGDQLVICGQYVFCLDDDRQEEALRGQTSYIFYGFFWTFLPNVAVK
jgi:hypothetical protein